MDVRIADAREGFGGVYHENVGLCCEKSGTESVLMAAVIQLHTGGIHFGVSNDSRFICQFSACGYTLYCVSQFTSP